MTGYTIFRGDTSGSGPLKRVEVQAISEDEPRYLVIGRLANKYWSAVITKRGSTIRIISVRRSRKKEVELYES